MLDPLFYNALYGINYRLPNVSVLLYSVVGPTHCKTMISPTIKDIMIIIENDILL